MRIELEGNPGNTVDVAADALRLQRVYVIAESGSAAATTERSGLGFRVEDMTGGKRTSTDTIFNGKTR